MEHETTPLTEERQTALPAWDLWDWLKTPEFVLRMIGTGVEIHLVVPRRNRAQVLHREALLTVVVRALTQSGPHALRSHRRCVFPSFELQTSVCEEIA